MHKRGGKKQWVHRGKRVHGQQFWDKEYRAKRDYPHLALSTAPSEDFVKFTKWLERRTGHAFLNQFTTFTDLGCGNGRNLIYAVMEYGGQGIGYDISREAVTQATRKAATLDLPLTFEARSIAGLLPLPDASQTIVLDMMTSHFLNATEREQLRKEVYRILKPGGWFFFKTFFLEEDRHAERLIRTFPTDEENTYMHPEIGQAEHVTTQEEIEHTFAPYFTIERITTSHRHQVRGNAFKRRSICVYARKAD